MRRLFIKFFMLMIIICLLVVLNRHLKSDNGDSGSTAQVFGSASSFQTDRDEIRGAWIASVYNIDFPSKQGLTSAQQKSGIVSFLENAKNLGLNTVVVQVRPTGDALYPSNIFPWSKWLTGTQGVAPSPYYDPLEYMIEQAHARGLKIHAWINPYRITRGKQEAPQTDVLQLSQDNPARENPSWTVPYADGCLYINPGIPEVRKLVIDGVMEIVNNYDIDGIHMDDYFYPYKVMVKDKNGKNVIADFDDGDTFKKYGAGFDSVEDWRRHNVDLLIEEMGQAIHASKPNVLFGISPFAVWANKTNNKEGSDTDAGVETYYDHYADTRKWVREEWIDYICPQIYWPIGYGKADFKEVADWWSKQVKGTKVKLVIGHAAYKVGSDPMAQWSDANQIIKQLEYARGLKGYGGSLFYGFSSLVNNTLGISDNLRKFYQYVYTDPEILGKLPARRNLIIASPQNNYKSTSGWCYILGSSDPSSPLTVNGKTVKRTSDGHFALYFCLKKGENQFVFDHKGVKTTHIIKSTVAGDLSSAPSGASASPGGSAGSSVSAKPLAKYGFQQGGFTPSVPTTRRSGDDITFSCLAPPGSTVRVTLAGITVALRQQSGSVSDTKSLVPVPYSASMKLPSKSATKVSNLGKPVFKATRGKKSATYKSPNSVSVYPIGYYSYAQVTGDQIYLRTSPSGETGNQWDYSTASNGMVDYIYGEENGYYLLRFGGWISKSQVKVYPGKKLYINRIKDVRLSQNERTTDAIFSVLENVPYDVDVENDKVTLTIFNTSYNNIPQPPQPRNDNPLISKITVKRAGISEYQYIFYLKKPGGFYGYDLNYENSKMIFSLKHPAKIQKRDKPLSGIKVALDPGHGGGDPGALGPLGASGATEDDFALSLAYSVKRYLEQKGASVYMTRYADERVELYDRVDWIEKQNPDLSVSLHYNSLDFSSDVTKTQGMLGLYTYDYWKNAADTILKTASERTGRIYKGCRWQNIALGRQFRFPSVLLEMGFMTNPEEYQWNFYEQNREILAKGIADGIEKYFLNQ